MSTAPRDPHLLLTAGLIGELFEELSEHLKAAASYGHHMMIAGGAALALRWDDRVTRDVDVLEHRFRRTPSDRARSATAVDFISMRFPDELQRAAELVGQAYGLPWNWLNGAAAIFTPVCDLCPETLYRSDYLTIESPGPSVLLAMKLHAGRDRDLEDAARLAAETKITDSALLVGLVVEAYGHEANTARTADFVASVIETARRREPKRL